MSSGADCWFTETEPGRWIYGVQHWPYGETEEYDEYGPFKTATEAYEHMHANHQNPGGFSMGSHADHVHSGEPYETWDHRWEWACCMNEVEEVKV